MTDYFTSDQIRVIEVYTEQVIRGAKPVADIGVFPVTNQDEIVEELLKIVSGTGLRFYLQEYADEEQQCVAIYLYKYPWVEDLLDFLSASSVDWAEEGIAFHIICGMMYGYGLAEIGEFVEKQKVIDKYRKTIKAKRESEDDKYD